MAVSTRCLLCQRTGIVYNGPSNSDVYAGPTRCEHMLCTYCHQHLKHDEITRCPICQFDMSAWQKTHLRHEDLFHDMTDYDTDDEGYAFAGEWLKQPEWRERLAAVAKHTQTLALEKELVDKAGVLHTLKDITQQLCEQQEDDDGYTNVDIDDWTFTRENESGKVTYIINVTMVPENSCGSSLYEAYTCSSAAVTLGWRMRYDGVVQALDELSSSGYLWTHIDEGLFVSRKLPGYVERRITDNKFLIYDRCCYCGSGFRHMVDGWYDPGAPDDGECDACLKLSLYEAPRIDSTPPLAPAPAARTEAVKTADAADLVRVFRDDLIVWLSATKKVGECFAGRAIPEPYHDIADEPVWIQGSDLQLELFMLSVDESRYGALPYEVYKSLLSEINTIKRYVAVAGLKRKREE